MIRRTWKKWKRPPEEVEVFEEINPIRADPNKIKIKRVNIAENVQQQLDEDRRQK
jgi:hypothetical protein